MSEILKKLVQFAMSVKAEELELVSGYVPSTRVKGNYQPVEMPDISLNRSINAVFSFARNFQTIIVDDLDSPEKVNGLFKLAQETNSQIICAIHEDSHIELFETLNDSRQNAHRLISGCLLGILNQCLITSSQGGYLLAYGVAIGTPAVRNLIHDEHVHQLHAMIQVGKKFGIATREYNLANLIKRELITEQDAYKHARHYDQLERIINENTQS